MSCPRSSGVSFGSDAAAVSAGTPLPRAPFSRQNAAKESSFSAEKKRTASARLGRVGSEFYNITSECGMRSQCGPNSIASFMEFLLHYATPYTRGLGDRLIAKAPTFRADSAKWDWEVNVITSKELNAWCMAGGKIAVYTALVEQLQLNDDEIATVMGHEIAHALREHVREQMSTQALKQGALNIASLFGVSNTTLNIANTLAEVGVSLPFSRSHETEADELGLELMYRAGYDPQKGIKIWEKMMSLGSGNTGLAVLLSTHPADDERLANLTELAAQLKADK